MTATTLVMRTLTCKQCGMDWERPRVRGNPPVRCPACRSIPRPRRPQAVPRTAPPKVTGVRAHRLDTNTAGYRVAMAVTTYRLAIEEATCALRLGRLADALAVLERVEAPARAMENAATRKRVIELPE